MTTGDILAAGLAELREHGWTQGTLLDSKGQMCARGALFKAVTGNAYGCYRSVDDRAKIDKAEKALEENIPQSFTPPHGWDAPNLVAYNNTRTSFTEIEEWFEKAIANEGVSNGIR